MACRQTEKDNLKGTATMNNSYDRKRLDALKRLKCSRTTDATFSRIFDHFIKPAAAALGICAFLLIPFDCSAQKIGTQTKKGVTSKTQAAAKPAPPCLAKSDKVVAAFKKVAESEPTVLSGKIVKSVILKGLVVIKTDATLASDEIELTPTSGTIVVNNSAAVWYRPVKIKGVPFASVMTSAQAGQKSHMFVAARYWGEQGLYENCVFKGQFNFDTTVTPCFSNCVFTSSAFSGGDSVFRIWTSMAIKDKYVNSIFQGFKPGSLNDFAMLIASSKACGFKGISFTPAVPCLPNGKDFGSPPFPTEAQFYDFDGTIAPALPQLTPCYKDNPQFKYKALDPKRNTLPYCDKLDEIGALLNEVAAKYVDPKP